VLGNPDYYRQFRCGESLLTIYDCPLRNRFVDMWARHNYFVYVIEGRKIWHTPHGSFDLRKERCVFIRKGASIVEQFFDVPFCLVVFSFPMNSFAMPLKRNRRHCGSRQNENTRRL
jgi:hypothetical protein